MNKLLGRKWMVYCSETPNVSGFIWEYNSEITAIENLDWFTAAIPSLRVGSNATWILTTFFPSIGWRVSEVVAASAEPVSEKEPLTPKDLLDRVLSIAAYAKEVERLNDRLNEVFRASENYRNAYIQEKEKNKRLQKAVDNLVKILGTDRVGVVSSPIKDTQDNITLFSNDKEPKI